MNCTCQVLHVSLGVNFSTGLHFLIFSYFFRTESVWHVFGCPNSFINLGHCHGYLHQLVKEIYVNLFTIIISLLA